MENNAFVLKTYLTELLENVGGSSNSEVGIIRMLYFPLIIVTLLVNKYVLSVLKFTYPTIFQGWQMASGVIVLKFLSLMGKMEQNPSIRKIDRTSLKFWIPALILHVISIYSGSVTLARMPIPLYLAVHNTISVLAALVDLIHSNQQFSAKQVTSMVVILVTLVIALVSYPGSIKSSIVWGTVHVISSGLYLLYEKEIDNEVDFSYTDRLYYNYVFSAVLLAPIAYVLGDLVEAQNFPFLYVYHFYVGCLASGLFGSLACLLAVKLKENHDYPGCVSSIAKIVSACLSLFLFDWLYSRICFFWICFNLLANVALKYSSRERVIVTTCRSRSVSLHSNEDVVIGL